MIKKKTLLSLDGNRLTINQLNDIVNNDVVSIEIEKSALKKVSKSRKFLETHAKNKIIYGVNTGFGPMASYIIDGNNVENLQKNLILSHAVGMGGLIDSKYILAAMVVRLNTLIKGHSGITLHLVDTLVDVINHRIIPVVPEHGGVGASGDLIQLAHIAATLIGEGDVVYRGNRIEAREALKKCKIMPHTLLCKEGLALINGTSMMSGIAALHCKQVERLTSIAIRLGCMSLELAESMDDSIAKILHDLRAHKGQTIVAEEMRKILSSSKLLKSRRVLKDLMRDDKDVYKIDNNVQEYYSLRCIPQIVGPLFDILEHFKKITTTEINSVTDNPILDLENETFLHGGNFHGDYISTGIDQLKVSLVKLSMLSERRTNYFLHEKLNKKFPPFMNLNKPGLTMGLQGLQFVSTSTTAQNQSLAFPHSVHSIPTNADNQDIVSMGTDATLILSKVISNTYIVFAIELITLAQGIDFQKNVKFLSTSSKMMYESLRRYFPKVSEDKNIDKNLEKVRHWLESSNQFDMHIFS